MNIPDKLLPPKKRTYSFAFSDTIDQSYGGLKAEKSLTPAVSMIIKPIHNDNLLLPPNKRRYTASTFYTTVQETRVVDQPEKPSTLAFSMIKPVHNNNLLLPPTKPIYATPLAFIANNQLTVVDQHDYIKRPRRLDDDLNNNNWLLESLRQHVRNNNMDFKDITDVQILMDKQLKMSDLKDSQARLSLPKIQIDPVVFLTCDEEAFLEKKVGVIKNNHIEVKVIMGSSVYKMHLSRWNYANNKARKGSWRYVLQHNWKKLKSDNNLQVDDIVRVVSFRSENRINFAILGPKRTFSLFGTRVEAFPWY